MPVDGKAHLFYDAEERKRLSQTINDAQQDAFELALLGQEHAVARTLLNNMQVSADQRAELMNKVDRATNSLVDAWVNLAELAVTDMQKGRDRAGRYDELANGWGIYPLEPEEWVRRLITFKHERVAQKLADLLKPYAERTHADYEAGELTYWTVEDRDALQVILATLGDIEQPEIAVDALYDFALRSSDTIDGEDNITVQAGLALCALGTKEADGRLWGLQVHLNPNKDEVSLPTLMKNGPSLRSIINRRMARTPDYGGDIEESNDHEHWKHLTLNRMKKGQYEAALESANKWIELNMGNYGEAQQALEALGEPEENEDEELAEQRRAARVHVDNCLVPLCHATIRRGHIYFWLGRLAEAEVDLLWVLEKEPRFTDTHKILGMTYMGMGNIDEAFKHINLSIELNPKNAQAWAGRGTMLVQVNQFEEALADLNRAVELGTTDPNHIATRGIAH